MDLRREQDIEQLRRIALAQQVQIEQLLRVLQAKCEELQAFKGDPGELQQTLALVETLTKQRNAVAAASEAKPAGKDKKAPKPREKSGPTDQPKLPFEERVFELDQPDCTCPSCGGELRAIEGQFEESEMIDVVEVSYRVVKVKQQKYSCRCGGCIETALGPERAIRGGRYSLDFAIKVALDARTLADGQLRGRDLPRLLDGHALLFGFVEDESRFGRDWNVDNSLEEDAHRSSVSQSLQRFRQLFGDLDATRLTGVESVSEVDRVCPSGRIDVKYVRVSKLRACMDLGFDLATERAYERFQSDDGSVRIRVTHQSHKACIVH